MRKQLLFLVTSVVWMLCLGLLARGQTPITINGQTTVCKNSTWTYSVPSPTPGLSYKWTLPALGNLSAIYGTSTNILWTLPGSTTLTVEGKNATGTTVEIGTLPITVQPLPQPFITTDYRVACELLPQDTSKEHQSNKPKQLFDDSGCVKVCEGSWVTYTANGFSGSSFQWTVSGGDAFPSGNTCTVHWGTPGQGSISVKETTAAGCIGTRTICIEIIGKPHASFGALPDTAKPEISICRNSTVIFIDRSFTNTPSPIVGWYWDFGDGNTFSSSTAVNPSHTYPTPNDYQVMLVVKNACNCTDTTYMKVHVMDEEGVQIDCPGVVCEGAQAHYQLRNNIPCGTYNWIAVGGTIVSPMPYGPSVDVVWDHVDTTGFGYLIFDASDCQLTCPGVTTIKIPVIQKKGYITGPTIVCPNGDYIYRLPQWPATLFNWTVSSSTGVTWNNTDQPNEIVVHTHGADILNIHCDYNNTLLGCSGKADLQVQVLPPEAIGGGKTKLCVGTHETYTLLGGSVGDWVLLQPDNNTQTGTGNSFTGVFNTPGTYTLTATGSTFCAPAPVVINVYPTPTVPDSLLGPDTVCVGVTYTFTAKNNQPGTYFQWYVTNGTFVGASTGNTVSVKFTGTVSTLQVSRVMTTDPHCESPRLTKTLYRPVVHPHITGPAIVCPNSYANYNGGNTSGETITWLISPAGAGSVSSGMGTQNVTVLWNNTNTTVTASLIEIVHKCDSDYTDTLHVTIQPAPVLTLSVPDSICRDVPLLVTLNIGTPGLSSASIHWEYGDGSTNTTISSGPVFSTSTSHAYNTLSTGAMKFPIAVTVTNPNGCTSTTTIADSVVVKPAPVASITPVGPLVHCNPVFSDPLTAALQAGFVPTSQLRWYNSAGLITSCSPPTCTTQNATAFTSYFVVALGSNGCSDTSNIVTEVQNCGPTCTITPTPVITVTHTQDCGAVQLTGNYSAGAISNNWTWPSTATGVSVTPFSGGSTLTCSFPVAGNYNFSYTAVYLDGSGHPCAQTVNHNALVPLVADMLYGVTCGASSYNVTLTDHSTYYPGTTFLTYIFKVNGSTVYSGSSNTVTVPLPANSYTFDEYVVFSYPGLGTDTCHATRSVVLPALPVAAFTFNNDFDCNGVPIHFNNGSTPAGISSFWTFGDGSSVTVTNPDKVYGVPPLGFWTAKLVVTNQYGCTSSVSHNVNITTNNLSTTMFPSIATICEGSSVTLSYIIGGATPITYEWMNDTSNFFTGTSNTLAVGDNGNYWVHVTDAHRCEANTSPSTQVSVINVPEPVISGDSLQCQGQSFTLSGYAGPDVTTYQWTRNGPVVGTGPDLPQSGLAPGTYAYTLTVTVNNPGGGVCTRTSAPFNVTVFTPPARPTISYSPINCANYLLQLTSSVPGTGTFAWSNGMSGNPIQVNMGGPYKVWFTDQHGCTSDTSAYVPKDPKGYLWVFPEGCYTRCLPVGGLWLYGPIIPFYFWEWDHNYAAALTGTNSVVTPYNITGPGQYSLTLNNGLCQATSGDMYLQLDQNCGGGRYKCDQVNVKLAAIDYKQPGCSIFLTFNFTNTTGASLPYTVTSNQGGYMIPPSGTIVTGSSSGSVQWVPPATFAGGPVTFTVTYILPDGTQCHTTIDADIKCGGPKIDCSNLKASIVSITYDANCHVFVKFQFDNSSGVNVPYTIVAVTGGTMVPASGTAAAGSTTSVSQWIPPAGFTSGTAAFRVLYTLPNGKQCRFDLRGSVRCPNGPVQRNVRTEGDDLADGNSLVLAPNPAQQTTAVKYTFGSDNANGKHSLEVYDITGRRVLNEVIKDEQGTYTLNVQGWIDGLYQVVLRSDGAVVAVAKLSVLH